MNTAFHLVEEGEISVALENQGEQGVVPEKRFCLFEGLSAYGDVIDEKDPAGRRRQRGVGVKHLGSGAAGAVGLVAVIDRQHEERRVETVSEEAGGDAPALEDADDRVDRRQFQSVDATPDLGEGNRLFGLRGAHAESPGVGG